MKQHQIFYWIAGIWSIDFFTTVIDLNYFQGFYELNKIPVYFYNHGIFGFIFFFLIAMMIFYIFSFFLYKISLYDDKKHQNLIQIIPIAFFVIAEVLTIINNVILIA